MLVCNLQSIDRHPPKPVGRALNVRLNLCDWLKGITWSVVSQLCSSFPAVNFMIVLNRITAGSAYRQQFLVEVYCLFLILCKKSI